MLMFRISVPGVARYRGLFASCAAAQEDAARKFPGTHPASVVCLTRLALRRAA
jgi:hypothetical protein